MAHIERRILKSGTRVFRVRDGAQAPEAFPLKRDADLYKADYERRTALGELFVDDAPRETLEQFLEGWLDRYKTRVRPSTFARRKAAILHLEPFQALNLDTIRARDVEDHVGKVCLDPRPGRLRSHCKPSRWSWTTRSCPWTQDRTPVIVLEPRDGDACPHQAMTPLCLTVPAPG